MAAPIYSVFPRPEGGDARSGSVSGLCVSRALATACRVWSNEQTRRPRRDEAARVELNVRVWVTIHLYIIILKKGTLRKSPGIPSVLLQLASETSNSSLTCFRNEATSSLA